MFEISWEICAGARECTAWLIIHPLTIVIVIPTLAVIFGGLVKWILAGGPLLSGLGRRPLSHVPTVMPALVAGIHGIGGTLETLKTWMAGTTPGHDANGDDLAGRVPVVEATRKRRKSATFPRPRQRSTGQPWA